MSATVACRSARAAPSRSWNRVMTKGFRPFRAYNARSARRVGSTCASSTMHLYLVRPGTEGIGALQAGRSRTSTQQTTFPRTPVTQKPS